MKVLVLFYSMYGHVYTMAEAIAEGARSVPGAEVTLMRVPELVPDEVLEKSGAKEAQKAFAHVPVATVDALPEFDAIVIGSPTRYGNMAAQMRNFLDQTGGLWMKGALEGKVGSAFTSTASQHGGQETTLMGIYTNMFHFGMVLVGLPYSEGRQMTMDEITGGSPYGVTTLSGGDGSRMPSENELAMARTQGKRVAEIAGKLAK